MKKDIYLFTTILSLVLLVWGILSGNETEVKVFALLFIFLLARYFDEWNEQDWHETHGYLWMPK